MLEIHTLLAKFWPAGSYVTFGGSLECNDSASFNRIWHHQHFGTESKWVRRISQGNFKPQHLAAVARKFVFPNTTWLFFC